MFFSNATSSPSKSFDDTRITSAPRSSHKISYTVLCIQFYSILYLYSGATAIYHTGFCGLLLIYFDARKSIGGSVPFPLISPLDSRRPLGFGARSLFFCYRRHINAWHGHGKRFRVIKGYYYGLLRLFRARYHRIFLLHAFLAGACHDGCRPQTNSTYWTPCIHFAHPLIRKLMPTVIQQIPGLICYS